ncbi:MAG: hypothetical protein KJ737_23090 [Proteobacteria bacterium]|nr:hypothetical protein [Pseudomonadota bacterium]
MAYEKLKYAWDNLLDTAAISYDGWAEDSDYPKENLFNKRMSKRAGFVWSKAGSIVIDLGVTRTVNHVAIMNHNLTAGASLSLSGNSVNFWGSPAFTATIPYRELDTCKVFDTSQNYRYWRLTINNSGRPDPDIKIGELLLGNLLTLPRNHDWNLKEQHHYTNITHETEGGNTWAYTLNSRKSWVMTWSGITGTELNPIALLVQSIHGSAYPFLMVLEDTPYYVRAQDSLSFERPMETPGFEALGPDVFPVDFSISELSLIEETRGVNQ